MTMTVVVVDAPFAVTVESVVACVGVVVVGVSSSRRRRRRRRRGDGCCRAALRRRCCSTREKTSWRTLRMWQRRHSL